MDRVHEWNHSVTAGCSVMGANKDKEGEGGREGGERGDCDGIKEGKEGRHCRDSTGI